LAGAERTAATYLIQNSLLPQPTDLQLESSPLLALIRLTARNKLEVDLLRRSEAVCFEEVEVRGREVGHLGAEPGELGGGEVDGFEVCERRRVREKGEKKGGRRDRRTGDGALYGAIHLASETGSAAIGETAVRRNLRRERGEEVRKGGKK
jgi:hypothetical protein